MWRTSTRARCSSAVLVLLAALPAAAQTAFRPRDPAAAAVVSAVDAASDVRAAVYELDLEEAAEALARAKARGPVQVLLDEGALFPEDDSGGPGPTPPAVLRLLEAGLEVRVLRGAPPYGSMHTKFAVLDGRRVLDGSFNWTRSSEDLHFDDLEVVEDAALAAAYRAYFDWMWSRARPAREALADPGRPYPVPDGPPPGAGGAVRWRGLDLPPVSFSPGGGTLDLLTQSLRRSTASVDAAVFSFWAFQPAGALVGALERGARVRLIVDREQAAGSPVTAWLLKKGVELRVLAGPGGPGPHSRMHHKFAVLDGSLLAAGSFNWSLNAERRSYETLRFTDRAVSVGAYRAWFERLWAQAEPAGTLAETGAKVVE